MVFPFQINYVDFDVSQLRTLICPKHDCLKDVMFCVGFQGQAVMELSMAIVPPHNLRCRHLNGYLLPPSSLA